MDYISYRCFLVKSVLKFSKFYQNVHLNKKNFWKITNSKNTKLKEKKIHFEFVLIFVTFFRDLSLFYPPKIVAKRLTRRQAFRSPIFTKLRWWSQNIKTILFQLVSSNGPFNCSKVIILFILFWAKKLLFFIHIPSLHELFITV